LPAQAASGAARANRPTHAIARADRRNVNGSIAQIDNR
jgi:hypothetical protein